MWQSWRLQNRTSRPRGHFALAILLSAAGTCRAPWSPARGSQCGAGSSVVPPGMPLLSVGIVPVGARYRLCAFCVGFPHLCRIRSHLARGTAAWDCRVGGGGACRVLWGPWWLSTAAGSVRVRVRSCPWPAAPASFTAHTPWAGTGGCIFQGNLIKQKPPDDQ